MDFVGRQRELAIASETLGPGKTLTLVGPSGVGKSTLAQELVRQADGESRFVDCFGLDFESVASAVARAAGLKAVQSSADELLLRAADALQDVALLVLDDFADDQDRLKPLRSNWPGALLVTCHTPPTDGAVLPMSAIDVVDLADFASSEACSLFDEAARSANLTFELDPRDVEIVREIALRLHGHPLGLALAGRRAGTTSPRTVLELLDSPGTLTDRQRPARHQSISAALRFSWESLDDDERRALYVMALFHRPLRPETVAMLCAHELGDTLEIIATLVRRGIVAQSRFPRPLTSFVDVARESYEAANPEDARAVVARACSAAAEAACALPIGFVDHPDFEEEPSLWQFVIDRDDHDLTPEQFGAVLAGFIRWTNIRANAFGEVASVPKIDALIRDSDDWNCWFQLARHHSRDQPRALVALRHCERLATTDEQHVHTHALTAFLAAPRGEMELAVTQIEALEKFEDAPPIASVVAAEVFLRIGDLERARAALERFSTAQNQTAVTRAYAAALRAWTARSDDEALSAQQEAVELCVQAGRLRSEASARMGLGALLGYRLGDLVTGLEEVRRAAVLARRVGDGLSMLRAEAEEVGITFHSGDFERVLEIGDPNSVRDPYCWVFWVISCWEVGDRAAATQMWLDPANDGPIAAVPAQDGLWCAFDVRMRGAEPDAGLARATMHTAAHPDFAALLQAVVALSSCNPSDDLTAKLAAWTAARVLYQDTNNGLGWMYIRRVCDAEAPVEFAGFAAAEAQDAPVVVLDDYAAVLLDSAWTDLTSRPVSRRLLEILAESDEPLDHQTIGELLYPGEVVTEDAMTNRINVQISKLRKIGLKPYLAKRPEGFVLEADVRSSRLSPE